MVGRKQFVEANHSTHGNRGETITIAVVDSIYEPDEVGIDVVTGKTENYVASSEPITNLHGLQILHIISEYAPEAIYETHRVTIDNGNFKPSNFLKAMYAVKQSSVDILNISGGKHHKDCKQHCRICTATSEVVDSGTIVVAGAGNSNNEPEKTLYCPALYDGAIAVGSYESRCGFQIFESEKSNQYRTVPQNLHPPGSYWVTGSPEAPDIEPANIAFCSRRGCSDWHSCVNNRKEQLSDVNVSFARGEPDVFALDHYPYRRADGTVGIDTGTSFATALVTGALADILSTVAERRPLPTPDQVMDAIRNIPTTVDGTSQRKFDSEAVYRNLR